MLLDVLIILVFKQGYSSRRDMLQEGGRKLGYYSPRDG
jgi:hypothetical protein